MRSSLKWKKGSPIPTPTKQATLDTFLAGPTMPRKANQSKSKAPNVGYIHDDRFDSIETVSPELSTSEESKREGKSGTKSSSRTEISELELSPTRRSPRLHVQRNNIVPKYSLPLVQSPPLPTRCSELLQTHPPPPTPLFNQPLAIDAHQGRSSSEPTPSYHTALTSSPVGASLELSDSTNSTMDTGVDKSLKETDTVFTQKEIPSSVPWENTPVDGYGDTWPSTCSDSSPKKSSQANPVHLSQPHRNNSFRIPNSVPSCVSIDDTQDESQAHHGTLNSSQQSPRKHVSHSLQGTVFRTPESRN